MGLFSGGLIIIIIIYFFFFWGGGGGGLLSEFYGITFYVYPVRLCSFLNIGGSPFQLRLVGHPLFQSGILTSSEGFQQI